MLFIFSLTIPSNQIKLVCLKASSSLYNVFIWHQAHVCQKIVESRKVLTKFYSFLNCKVRNFLK